MMFVELANGGKTEIDDSDAGVLGNYNWHRRDTEWTSYVSAYLAAGNRPGSKAIHLHRLIIGAVAGQFVDHINGNGLDNRRSNLRLATTAQNAANMRGNRIATSIYKGVWFETRTLRWCAAINSGNRRIWLGRFETELEAAAAYDVAAAELFGEFARPNLGG